jgi:hypothetical protein
MRLVLMMSTDDPALKEGGPLAKKTWEVGQAAITVVSGFDDGPWNPGGPGLHVHEKGRFAHCYDYRHGLDVPAFEKALAEAKLYLDSMKAWIEVKTKELASREAFFDPARPDRPDRWGEAIKRRWLPWPGDVSDRCETGGLRFGDDWPGLFIRGDNALHLGLAIEHMDKLIMGQGSALYPHLKNIDMLYWIEIAAYGKLILKAVPAGTWEKPEASA